MGYNSDKFGIQSDLKKTRFKTRFSSEKFSIKQYFSVELEKLKLLIESEH